jgi:uncharacterized protein (DUF433 family)
MAGNEGYVREDDEGVYRVAGTRVMLDSVVAAFHQGHSPETMQQQYPALTLEQVYGALTFYLSHSDEVSAYLERQDEVWSEWQVRSEDASSPVVERLRALRRSPQPGRREPSTPPR